MTGRLDSATGVFGIDDVEQHGQIFIVVRCGSKFDWVSRFLV